MAKFEKRQVARNLRKRGHSIGAIAAVLGVSKSSVSLWCTDLKLTKRQREVLRANAIKAGHKGRVIGAEMNRKKKLDRIAFFKESGKKGIGVISQRDLLMVAIALYWAEGAKTESRFMFINSDPKMVKMMTQFLKEVLGVPKDQLRATIQINETHRPRIKKILSFWSSLLHLPRDQFGKPYFIKTVSKKVYDNHDSYYGILRLSVAKGSAVQYRMLGLINALKPDN